MLSLNHPVVCIVGPTASGKTDLAQSIAQQINGEVVSADSMQIYRGMDIGTGKISSRERLVVHHGFDLVDPGQTYSAAEFQLFARTCFLDIDKRGKRSVLAGGTGLYVRAAIDAFEFPKGEQVNNPVREKYTRYAEEHGAQALWDLLSEIDPASAAVLHPNNIRRVVRAFEMKAEGASYAQQKENLAHIEQAVPAVFIGLSVDKNILNERINFRVDRMIASGLVDEVTSLLNRGYREGLTAQQAIGYKEIVAALEGECSLEEGVEAIKLATRRYAKRQRTWYRKDERIHWLDANEFDIERLTSESMKIIC